MYSMGMGKSWSIALLGLGLVLGWLSSCSATAGHSVNLGQLPVRQLAKRSESDIPEDYKIPCGSWYICDGRTEFCSDEASKQCESCATDICALGTSKDDFAVQAQCKAECPEYYKDMYCEIFAAKCSPPTTAVASSTAVDYPSIIKEKDKTIASKDTTIVVLASLLAIVVILLVIWAVIFCYRERKCRPSTSPQPDQYSGGNTGTELQLVISSDGSLNGTHDSGNSSSASQQSSPGGTTSRARGSDVKRPTYTTPDQSTQGLQNLGNSGGPPPVNLDPFIGEPQVAAVHGAEGLPVSPTQVARGEGQTGGGGNVAFFAQPQRQSSLDGQNLNPQGKDVPEPGCQSNSTQNIVTSPEDSSYSQSKMALGRLDTDGSRAPLLGPDSEETSLKQRFTE